MVAWSREKLWLFLRHSEGMAAIEMAFIFPVMLVLYFGMVDVTNLISANRRVTIGASTIADLVTQEPGSTNKANLAGFNKAIQPIMDPFPSSTVGIQVFDYRLENGAVKRKWHNESGPTCGSAPTQNETANFGKLMTDGNDLVITRVCIKMKPIIGSILKLNEYNLNEQFALRPRQSLTLLCGDCPQG
jgi:Flp pilus assembly protein TadG